MKVGSLAVKEAKNRGVVKLLARVMDVTPQTIQRWKRMARVSEHKKLGRPRLSKAKHEEIRAAVRAEMKRQGNPGWRAVSHALPDLSVRYVQKYVAEVKRERRAQERRRIGEARVSTEVLAREAIWTIDGTHLGRESGQAIEAQVVKDRGSLAYRAIRVGTTAKSGDVTATLEAQKSLPLVLASDNGAQYCSEETAKWLEQNKIVHLRSLPRTPQHNGAAEIGIQEAKRLSNSPEELINTVCLLNNHRHRGSKAYKTSAVLDAELPVAYHKVDRAVFYEKCMARLSDVKKRPTTWRERRMSEREVIYAMLEEYGLIRRTGGGV
jgi:transposase InsO family protein